MFQWTGPRLQRRVIPWMLVKDEDTSKGVADAIEKDVPVPTLTTALFTRFRSRQEESFAEKMLAALRNAFWRLVSEVRRAASARTSHDGMIVAIAQAVEDAAQFTAKPPAIG